MIIGIGCDLVQIPRIKMMLSQYGNQFLQRIFSDYELQIMPTINNIENYIAKRYAAKEAFSKAMGVGIGAKISFKQIEILKHSSGQPFFSEKSIPKGISAFLSMSDDDPVAMAYVVLTTTHLSEGS